MALQKFSQNDRGKELKKEVKMFCKTSQIRTVCSRAYNPQSQGKLESSDREIRNKIYFDIVNLRKKRSKSV